MSIAQKDISNLETQPELPDTFDKQGDLLRVKPDGSGDTEWFGFSGCGCAIPIDNILLSDGTATAPSLSFQNENNSDTGIYRDAENSLSVSAGGLQRLQVTQSNVTVGTVLNNADLIVRGNIATNRYFAGDGLVGTPSYSFTNSNGTDTGMYYNYSGGTTDNLIFSVNGQSIMNLGQGPGLSGLSTINNKVLLNGGSSTNPILAVNGTSFSTGFSGDTSNNIWTLNNGSINTTHSTTGFSVGRNDANNTNMRTLTANGPSSFNTFTPNYSLILNNQLTTNRTDGNWTGVDCDTARGVYILGSNGSGSGVVRIAVSGANNLTSWTTYNDSTFAFGNMSNIAYSPIVDRWVIGTKASVTSNFFYSAGGGNTSTWTAVGTNIPFSVNRPYRRLRFINGQFVAISTTSVVVFSSDGINWTLRQIGGSYDLQEIVYSPELKMYCIATGSNNILYYYDPTGAGITSTTTFSVNTGSAFGSVNIGWSPKLSLFISQSGGNVNLWQRSSDGISWTSYSVNSVNALQEGIDWVSDFGGFFVGTQASSPTAPSNNCIVSSDGINWSLIDLTIDGNTRSFYYNSTTKTFVFGLDANASFKNALTDFNNFIEPNNIYNTFNSNVRFSDTIEYQNQVITPVSGNNHYTISTFTRPEVVFDTSAVNANIYLQGSSFNGRVGCKFKFIKSNTGHNVIIHGYETTTLISPTGNVSSFNAQSSPQTYSIIPVGYFGSFELTRISDSGNGVWIIDNVDVYDSAGTVRDIGNLSVASNLSVDGTTLLKANTDVGATGAGNSANLKVWGNLEYTGTLTGTLPAPSTNNLTLTGTTSFERVCYNQQNVVGPVSIITFSITHNYVRCYTTEGDVTIQLAISGTSQQNSAIGTRIQFQKLNFQNNVKIIGISTTSPILETPMGVMNPFTNSSTPNSFTVIPNNYTGNFELVRTETNTWRVENLQVISYPSNNPSLTSTFLDTNLIVNKNLTGNGTLTLDNLSGTSLINHNLDVVGRINAPMEFIMDIGTISAPISSGIDVNFPQMLGWGKYNYIVTTSTDFYIQLGNVNSVVYNNFTIYFVAAENTTSTTWHIQHNMDNNNHKVKVYKNGGITTLNNDGDDTTIDKEQWVRCTYKHAYRGSGNNYWLVHHYNSSA